MHLRTSIFSAAALTLAIATAAHGWVATVGPAGEDSVAYGVAIDADGNVLAGGSIAAGSGDLFSGAAKFDGVDGSVLWSTNIMRGHAQGFALDASGNAVVAGEYEDASQDLMLATVNGSTGTASVSTERAYGMQWYQTVEVDASGNVVAGGASSSSGDYQGSFMVRKVGAWTTHVVPFSLGGVDGPGIVFDVAVDGSGDVIAVGHTQEIVAGTSGPALGLAHPVAVKIRGSDGVVLWQRLLDESGVLGGVSLDASGNPVATGNISAAVGAVRGEDFIAVKLDATTGDDIWRTTIDGGVDGARDYASAAVHDAADDVFVGGRLETSLGDPVFGGGEVEFTMLKLAGADGAEVWRATLPNTVSDVGFFGGVKGEARAIALDVDDNPVVAGVIDAGWIGAGPSGNRGEFVVTRFLNATGERVWTFSLGWGEANAIAVSPDHGFAVAGRTVSVDGEVNHEVETERFTVVKFADTIEGSSARLSAGGTSARRRLIAASKDRDIQLPIRESQGDPTLHGARLIVTLSGSVADTYQLPAGNWARGRGYYKYRDLTGASGPCGTIVAKMGRQLKMRCLGAGLNIPSTAMNEVGIRLELGAERTARYCMRFAGQSVVRNLPGEFAAKLAPPPAACDGD